mmetsp:Transcript_13699/g.24814  ORF Transcript_13699/g.24814 Transcript_13699/m.24814 type:complete len:241 (-) Transcript_13699:1050-1772(-)
MPSHELEDQGTQRPPINSFGVPSTRYNFRCKELGRSTSCVGMPNHKLGQAKVCNLTIAVTIYQQVFRLEISVHNIPAMKMLKSTQDACQIKLCMHFGAVQAALIIHCNQIATQCRLKQKIQELIAIECRRQPDQKGIARNPHNRLLVNNASFCMMSENVALGQRLERKGQACGWVLYQRNSAESSTAKKPNFLKPLPRILHKSSWSDRLVRILLSLKNLQEGIAVKCQYLGLFTHSDYRS